MQVGRLAVAVVGGLLVLGAVQVQRADAQPHSLRFFGHGVAAPDLDRVKIRIDDPALPSDPGPPVDVGSQDFTIEFWLKALASENGAAAVSCGPNIDWIYGNILIDRDRFSQDRKYGVSIAGGALVFGVSGDGTGDYTICSVTDLLDGQWHHVALQRRRSDGRLWLYVDGALEAEADGPDGDISYPDDGVPGPFCGGPCTNSDPFIALGAEKHDAGAAFPSYSGWLDELRFSKVLRYAGGSFTPPSAPFAGDADTVGHYRFDAGPAGPCTGTVVDASGASGGPSDGVCGFGGSSPAGPIYSDDTPFATPAGVPALALVGRVVLALLIIASRPSGRSAPRSSP